MTGVNTKFVADDLLRFLGDAFSGDALRFADSKSVSVGGCSADVLGSGLLPTSFGSPVPLGNPMDAGPYNRASVSARGSSSSTVLARLDGGSGVTGLRRLPLDGVGLARKPNPNPGIDDDEAACGSGTDRAFTSGTDPNSDCVHVEGGK